MISYSPLLHSMGCQPQGGFRALDAPLAEAGVSPGGAWEQGIGAGEREKAPCGWGSLLWHPGAGGGKMSPCQAPALGTWSTSPASGCGTGGAQGPKAPPGDAEVFIPVHVSFIARDPNPRGICSSLPPVSPFPPHLHPQKSLRRGSGKVSFNGVQFIGFLSS